MSPVFAGLGRWISRLAAVAIYAMSLLPATAGAFPSSPGERVYAARAVPLVAVDWQGPLSLPPRFRNHCRYDPAHGGWYCANHCGPGYQFYSCSPESFGCCRPGFGYCDWKGHLRCAP